MKNKPKMLLLFGIAILAVVAISLNFHKNISAQISSEQAATLLDQQKRQNPYRNSGGPTYTMAQVAQHNTPTDCWIALNAKAYNLSAHNLQYPRHGARLLPYCGTDVSRFFSTLTPEGKVDPYHYASMYFHLVRGFYVGEVKG